MTDLSLTPLALLATALAARIAMPRPPRAASSARAVVTDPAGATPALTRFGGDPRTRQAREPAVAAFPRGL